MKNINKKIISVVLVLCFTLSLIACSETIENTETTEGTTITTEETTQPSTKKPTSESTEKNEKDTTEEANEEFKEETNEQTEELTEKQTKEETEEETEKETEEETEEQKSGTTVYITPTGSKYHYSKACAGKNAMERDLDDVSGSYGPCKKCA